MHSNQSMGVRCYTLGKLAPRAAMIAMVEEQTNAAELDNPDPEWK